MNTAKVIQNQLLATKFFIPIASGHAIPRPRLSALLDKGLKHPFTLVSAAAGFGKTTLLSTWARSLPPSHPLVAWVSLDAEDNDLRLFWKYILSALNIQPPHPFTSLLEPLQSSQAFSFQSLLAELINLLTESRDHFVLILDDYQVITEEQIHATIAYLIEHMPPQLHIMLATRADPPLPLPLLRARKIALEVRTDQLRCTAEETRAFLQHMVGSTLSDEIIQKVAVRTEGWLVGLQLLGLSFQQSTDPATLLEEVSGDQRYILEYLTQEVLERLPQEMQTFLVSTSILERFNASLCNAIMQETSSQQMLERLEHTNLFVVSLDSKREWYRYHALFAEALLFLLQQTHADQIPMLHRRASLWYAQHNQITQAILHAFSAHEWQWAADLIEQKSRQLVAFTWGASQSALIILRGWLDQLPPEVTRSRPRLCMMCAHLLWQVVPQYKLDAWLDGAEAALIASLKQQVSEGDSHAPLASGQQQEQENLLGQAITLRAIVRGHEENGHTALVLCQQALKLLSTDNFMIHAFVAFARLRAYYVSSANDALASIENGLQAVSFAEKMGQPALVSAMLGSTAQFTIGAGQLYKTLYLTQRAELLATEQGKLLPEVGYSAPFQADVLREWNELDRAHSLAEEAISLCQQTASAASLTFILLGYAMLLRVCLSRKELDAAHSALEQFERISKDMNPSLALHYRSLFTTVDQVKLWLACGELNRATRWAEELDRKARHDTPFTYEREEVARVRVLLAQKIPDVALQRLAPVLQRATIGHRWGHVIEVYLLQALAYQMLHQKTQALTALSEALQLAEPEGYIRSFVDEGPPMAALLSQLREQQQKQQLTPYLDALLAAFPKQHKTKQSSHLFAEEHIKTQSLLDPLSEREWEVLQLLAQGTSNQQIAQELVIALDTAKRHVSHIFAKLGVSNRVQAIRQAREFGLLD